MIAETFIPRILYEPLQVARMLGVHPVSVRRWLRSGKLRATCIGGKLMVDAADLNAFIEAGSEQYRQKNGINVAATRTPRQCREAADRAAAKLGVEIQSEM